MYCVGFSKSFKEKKTVFEKNICALASAYCSYVLNKVARDLEKLVSNTFVGVFRNVAYNLCIKEKALCYKYFTDIKCVH